MSDTHQSPEPTKHPGSPLHEAVVRVGDRWTLLVVEALLAGPRRFNELIEELPGIASNVLSQRLKALEGWGLVVGQPYSERPPRLAYQLSGAGRELAGALRLLAVHRAEAVVAHAGPAAPAVTEADGVAELVAGGLAPRRRARQVAVVQVQRAVPGVIGPRVTVEGRPAGHRLVPAPVVDLHAIERAGAPVDEDDPDPPAPGPLRAGSLEIRPIGG